MQFIDDEGRALLRRWAAYFRLTDQSALLLLAGIVGLCGAVGSLIFLVMLEGLTHLLRPEAVLSWLPYPWLFPCIPAGGALLAGLMISRWAGEAKGHGVPQVIKAVALNDGRMRPQVAVVKTLASALTIGSGGSAGQEGPMVQIGSTIGSTIAQRLNLSPNRTRILVASGAAAGISATFNAPFAGVLFALEVILGEFRLESFSPVVIASVISNIVWHEVQGAEPVFHIPAYALESPLEIPLYMVLGVLCGIVGVNFGKTLTLAEGWAERMPGPDWFKPAVGGALLGVLAMLVGPEILGNGYETISLTMAGTMPFWPLAFLVILKTLATNLTLGTGASGGIFAPALFMGAATGGAFGVVANAVLPAYTAGAGAYAVVGMAAVVASATHAPLTAMLIIFEMTGNYDMMLPVMLCSVIATLFARRVAPESIYLMKLAREGIHLRSGRDVLVLERLRVRDVMHTDVVTVRNDASLAAILGKIQTTSHSSFPVLNAEGRYIGMLSFDSVRAALTEVELRFLLIAADFVMTDYLTTTPAEDLHAVLQKMQRQDVTSLPVVSADDPTQLVGVVSYVDVIGAYNSEVAHRQITQQPAA